MATRDIVQSKDSGSAPVLLGGFAALAETSWMGSPQASDVLEPVGLGFGPAARRRVVLPSLPRLRLSGLPTRELSIAEATFVLMASFLLSAALGAVRQVLFNATFGAGDEANAYYAAFRLPDMLFSLVAGGALSSAMIPVLAGVRRDSGDEAGWELTSRVLNLLFGAFAVVVIVGEVASPAFVGGVLAPGFNPSTQALTVALTRIMLVQPLILAVGSVATAVLNARNQFFLTALSVASHNLTLIAGILAAHLLPDLGIFGPTLGVVGGAVLQVVILWPGMRGNGFRYRPILDLDNPAVREVIRLLVPNGLAVGVLYLGSIVDTSFASLAPEKAGLPAINNAWMLVGLPIALLGQAVGQSAFPRLAAHAADGEYRLLRQTILRAFGSVVALSLPALALLVLLGRPIIHVLFEHGRFDPAAGALTYVALVAYAAGLPAYVGTEVVSRGLIALRDTRTPLLTNTGQLAVRIALLALLVSRLGIVAVPLALAGAASIETVVLGIILLAKLARRVASESARLDGAPAAS